MREVEYFQWMLPPDPWRKSPSPSTWKMSREDAAERYPGAEPILSLREVRSLPETPAEMQANQILHNGRLRTPDEEKLSDWLVSRIGMKSERMDDFEGDDSTQ